MATQTNAIEKLKTLFQRLDVAKNGLVGEQPFKNVFKDAKVFSESEIESLLASSGTRRESMVDYAKFFEWMFGNNKHALQTVVERLTYGQAPLSLPKTLAGLDMKERFKDSIHRKCKIICTMGPACWDVDKLLSLIDCGMNVCRLNFSHGDHETHANCLKRIREAASKRPEKHIGILLDTKGPEIRTGFFKNGGKIELEAGQELKLVTDYNFKGDNTCIAISYKKLPQAVKPGNTVLLADGSLSLKVKSCGPDYVITQVMNNCSIGERKNCNLPGVKVDLPVLQDKDKDDLVNFGIPHNVDFVAASFVQSAADVKLIRDTLGEAGKNIKIISKIENQEGLNRFDEICAASDAIMVARGDLGMEIPPEKVFLAQKIMIAKCNLMGKPVVTATQMLESMTAAPRPTRAEAGDVANAVLDGTDCVMLSGETANGQFPVAAVTFMRKIVEEAETALDYNAIFNQRRKDVLSLGKHMSAAEATCSSAVKTAYDIDSPCIVVLTKTGAAARMISKYRPHAPIFMGSTQDHVLRQANYFRGVVGVKTTAGASVNDRIQEVIGKATELGVVKPGDVVVAVHGKDGDSNMLKMVPVPGGVLKQPKIDTRPSKFTYNQATLFLPKDMSNLDLLERTEDSFNRKCKIICTMGPSCWEVNKLVQLIDAGMNIARLNFSHGDHESHFATLERIREADRHRPDKPVGILLDTKGPEIRTGFFKEGDKVKLTAGQELKLVTDYSFKGDHTTIAVTYKKLPQSVKPGNTILMADGSLSLKVKSCGDDYVITEIMNNCNMGERKNCNLPGVKVDLPVLQAKDKDDLVNFGVKHGVNFIAASFVQSAADVKLIRDTLGEAGKDIKIISKIENQEGLKNFDEICHASDAIMIARGDLGMEIPPEKVFLAQKYMTAICNIKGKPVVTATQMLESMCKAPRPTRAEAGDVANAVLDGTDCVMLSGETAGGDFPVEAVTIMRRIVEEAESSLDFNALYTSTRETVLDHFGVMSPVESLSSTAVKAATDASAVLIIVIARSGHTARMIAKYRPQATVLAITDQETMARFLLTSRGVISLVTDFDVGPDELVHQGMLHAKRIGCGGVKPGAPVVMVAEESLGRAYVKLLKVP